MTWLERLLARLGVERHEIGREGIGTYLTRWVLAGWRDPETGTRRKSPGWKVFLHLFHRGDVEPYCHSHPWPFWSLILWGGYYEFTPTGYVDPATGERELESKWYGPLSLLRRPAEWVHRVEVPEGHRCWTLLWSGRKVQSWGFLCKSGLIHWRQHMANEATGKPGCGE